MSLWSSAARMMVIQIPEDSKARKEYCCLFTDLLDPFLNCLLMWSHSRKQTAGKVRQTEGKYLTTPIHSPEVDRCSSGGSEDRPSMGSGTPRSQRILSHPSYWSEALLTPLPIIVWSFTVNINYITVGCSIDWTNPNLQSIANEPASWIDRFVRALIVNYEATPSTLECWQRRVI